MNALLVTRRHGLSTEALIDRKSVIGGRNTTLPALKWQGLGLSNGEKQIEEWIELKKNARSSKDFGVSIMGQNESN
jgi:hypothetical protein